MPVNLSFRFCTFWVKPFGYTQTDGQIHRKWRTWAHRAYTQVGSKMTMGKFWVLMTMVLDIYKVIIIVYHTNGPTEANTFECSKEECKNFTQMEKLNSPTSKNHLHADSMFLFSLLHKLLSDRREAATDQLPTGKAESVSKQRFSVACLRQNWSFPLSQTLQPAHFIITSLSNERFSYFFYGVKSCHELVETLVPNAHTHELDLEKPFQVWLKEMKQPKLHTNFSLRTQFDFDLMFRRHTSPFYLITFQIGKYY